MLRDYTAKNPYEFSYTMRRKLQKKISAFLIFTAILSIIILLFMHFILFSASINSDAMNPQLQKHDQIFMSPLLTPQNPFFAGKDIVSRGDIVLLSPRENKQVSFIKKTLNTIISFITFRKLNFSSTPEMTNQTVLRRIIGIPGDTLYVCDYTVYIKPKESQYFLTEFELSGKMYDIYNNVDYALADFDQSLGTVGCMEEFTLRDDEYFVLCDNRISGIDSRIWGPVYEKEIIAKAVLRFFPIKKIQKL